MGQEQVIKFFDVKIDSDAQILLAIKALEVNARFINLRFVIGQQSLRHAVLINQKLNFTSFTCERTGLAQPLGKRIGIEFRLC